MNLNLLIIVVCLYFVEFASEGNIPLPQIISSTYCFTTNCFRNECEILYSQNKTIIAMISYSFSTDPYLALYVGWVMSLFMNIKDKVYFLLHQTDPEQLFEEETLKVLRILPSGSIFVNHERGLRSFGMYNMLFARNLFPEEFTLGIIHLDHEEPWEGIVTLERDKSVDLLFQSYEAYEFIVRNYYFSTLSSYALHIPAAIPKYGYIIGNPANTIYMSGISRVSSQRRYKCLFTGRNVYTEPLTHSMNRDRENLLKLMSFECIFLNGTSQESDYHSHSYEDYIQILGDTAFAPCPAGRNPETFRLYEALELGAIPLFVAPPADISFLNIGLWNEYPGPIFGSWDELEPFLSSISPRDMDSLQQQVQLWYAKFVVNYRNDVASAMDQFSTFVANLKKNRQISRSEGQSCCTLISNYEKRIQDLEHELETLRTEFARDRRGE